MHYLLHLVAGYPLIVDWMTNKTLLGGDVFPDRKKFDHVFVASGIHDCIHMYTAKEFGKGISEENVEC